MKLTSLRKIATVRARQSDKEEFVKLIHLTDGNSMRDGYLLDLHVSMLGESDENMEDEITQEDLQMLWKTIESLISEPSNRSPQESSSQRSQRMEDGSKQSRKQRTSSVDSTSSSPSNSASSINTASATSAARGIRQTNYSSLKRASSVWLERHLPYRSVNPFDYRQEEVLLGVQALENEMTEFRQALYETEDLIRNIQNDISDTRQKMTSYIKDMPDTHYSAVSSWGRG
ncbi:hypothetical protein BX666DRAFT_982921 [Dichotomocladium elegans]|nr:hypothetical protein BX666DRAFT_982921 [Dichotomocladium elegans]